MTSLTSMGGRSSKKLYPNSCPGFSVGSSTSGSSYIILLSVSAKVFLIPCMYSNLRLNDSSYTAQLSTFLFLVLQLRNFLSGR